VKARIEAESLFVLNTELVRYKREEANSMNNDYKRAEARLAIADIERVIDGMRMVDLRRSPRAMVALAEAMGTYEAANKVTAAFGSSSWRPQVESERKNFAAKIREDLQAADDRVFSRLTRLSRKEISMAEFANGCVNDNEMRLVDDGTLDTVLRCPRCKEVERWCSDYSEPDREEIILSMQADHDERCSDE
jgi:hypothetical protein